MPVYTKDKAGTLEIQDKTNKRALNSQGQIHSGMHKR